MPDISLVRFSPKSSSTNLMDQLVDCYREVFASAPWGEWLRCPVCTQQWGIEDKAVVNAYNFLHCNTSMVDFWPKEKVREDLSQEITADASCWVAVDSGRIIGFCWGYPIKVGDLEAKLNITFNSPELKDKERVVSYLDEVGVSLEYRGHKIAKRLTTNYMRDAVEKGSQFDVARVKYRPDPSITYLWYTQKMNYKVVAEYPQRDGRVVLGGRIPVIK